MSSSLALLSIQGLVFGAYTAVFVILFAFLGVLFLRVGSLRREVEDLRGQVSRNRPGEGGQEGGPR